jgi:hypothetical protein
MESDHGRMNILKSNLGMKDMPRERITGGFEEAWACFPPEQVAGWLSASGGEFING